jgi:hypothetical protein
MTEIRSHTADSVSFQPPEWLLDCQFVEENAAGLALGALEEVERIRIMNHLSWCPLCATLVHEMRKTVGYLPFTSPQAAPPASAKARLFERIASESVPTTSSSSLSLRTITIPTSNFEMAAQPAARKASGDATPPPGRRSVRWEAMVAPLAAVPLVLALAIVGGWALHTQNRLSDQVAESRTHQSTIAYLTSEITLLNNVLEGDSSNWYLAAADSAIGGGIGGKLTTLGTDEAYAKLFVWNLPAVSDGYQVILETKDGNMQRAGHFDVDKSGSAVLQLDVQESLGSYRAIHVQPDTESTRSSTNDSIDAQDVLWMDMESNLGSSGGTEANAKAH